MGREQGSVNICRISWQSHEAATAVATEQLNCQWIYCRRQKFKQNNYCRKNHIALKVAPIQRAPTWPYLPSYISACETFTTLNWDNCHTKEAFFSFLEPVVKAEIGAEGKDNACSVLCVICKQNVNEI